jgi:hypothetical protein
MSNIQFPIFVCDTRGTEDVFDVYSLFTVRRLKIIVSKKKKIPISNIDFIFNGKVLDDYICLAEGGMCKNCRIYMIGKTT